MSQKLTVNNPYKERLEVLVEGNAHATNTIVLVHGFGTNKDELGLFVDISQTLGVHFRIVRFDFSGYGDSEGRQEDITMEKMADDLRAVLEAVKKTFGGTTHIIAHSLGCIVTAMVASHDIGITVFGGIPHADSATALASLRERITTRGGSIDEQGVSIYPRKDEALQKLGPGFWESYRNVDRYGLVVAYAHLTKLFIIRPLQDKIVEEAASAPWKSVSHATYSELDGGHNFFGEPYRRNFLNALEKIFVGNDDTKQDKLQPLEILAAMPDDIPGIMAVQQETWLATYANDEHGITVADIMAKDFMGPQRMARWTKLLLEKKDTVKIFVAKTNSVVAFCRVEKGERVNKLSALYILPEFQGRGVGRQLTEVAFAWLGNQKDIVLDVVAYNQKAITVYEKMGFRKTGETPPEDLAKFPSGKTMPEIRMIKSFEKKI